MALLLQAPELPSRQMRLTGETSVNQIIRHHRGGAFEQFALTPIQCPLNSIPVAPDHIG